MKNVIGSALGDILLTANDSTNWTQFTTNLTNSKYLQNLMTKGINVYIEWCGEIYYLNGKTTKQLEEEFQNWWCDLMYRNTPW